MRKNLRRSLVIACSLLCVGPRGVSAAQPELVNIPNVDRTIKIELRYGTSRNIAGRALYPSNMPALVRPHVAEQLAHAQAILRDKGYGLKIWDAYRPKSVHEQLWARSPNTDYVADPTVGGSLHTCGVAVDATLVDKRGRELPMPTDFDDFTMAAMLKYTGSNVDVRRNLHVLQNAMARAGFYGLRTEWWHFVSRDWRDYPPIPEVMIVAQGPAARQPAPASSPAPASATTPQPAAPPTRSSAPPSAGTAATRPQATAR